MKSLLSSFTILLLLTPFVQADESVELDLAPLQSALEQRDLYKSVITEVVQIKTLPSLAEPLTTKGHLWMIPQAAFKWEQGNPATYTALYLHNQVYLLDEVQKSFQVYKPDHREVRPLMLLLGMGEDASYKGLLSNFEPQSVSHDGNSYTVTFTPDSGLMKRAVSELTLTLDLSTSFPSKIVWTQKDGAVITTTFKNAKFNKTIEEETFLVAVEEYQQQD